MMTESAQCSFEGQDIFVGLDISKKEWKASIHAGEYEHKTFSQPPCSAVLAAYLWRHFPGARYHCVYEAGYSGFWIHAQLQRLGIDCMVINPADVPTTHKESASKNDRVDARKLARHLRSGNLKGIYIPSRASQEDRSLVRQRACLVRKHTRCKNQIKALLNYYGYGVPEDMSDRYWSRRYIGWIEGIRLERHSGQQTLMVLLEELKWQRHSLCHLMRSIRRLASEAPYAHHLPFLLTVPGISLLAAMILMTELEDIHRFANIDRLASYVGLAPGEHSSGENQYQTGITHRCNAPLRHVMIEAAWVAIRKDPAMTHCFQNLSKRMPKNQAIVRIARKLLGRIYHIWRMHQPYQPGLMA